MSLKQAKLIERKDLTYDVFELTFEADQTVEFSGGQFITIKIDDKVPPCFRAYSIASSPAQSTRFKLCIKLVPEGRGTNWLNKLNVSDQINFIGPNGNFIFKNQAEKAFFIATGTGLAPFTSIIEEEQKKGNTKRMDLLFGVRHQKDLFYLDWLEELKSNGNFDYKPTLSRPETDWEGTSGRVTEVLKNSVLDKENTEYYICGLKNMIDDAVAILKEKGVNEENIHFEKYD